MTKTRGFSLIEMLLTLVVVGLISLIGWPRLHRTIQKSDVRSARTTVAAVFVQARAAAIQGSRTVTLQFSSTNVWATGTPRLTPAVGSTADTVGQVQNLYQRYGVAVSASPGPSLTIDPRGFTSTTSTTVMVSKAGHTDSLVVSGFGRLQQ